MLLRTARTISIVILSVGVAAGCSGQQVSSEAPAEPTAIAEPAVEAAAEPVDTDTAAGSAEPAGVFVESGLAIAGADPVAYFTQGAYVPGEASYTYEWGGATWQFASAEHRDLFAANPAQYAPQYGGFCAWAVSQGYTAKIDPTAWKIVDGKLYLNYDQKIQQRWSQDIPGNIVKADQNWPAVLNQ
ncbi:YHS domain-containing protein [filamentous cyanobacterium CCP5]|nr:YHS domain-containing protein [filamentous cyanobacterium CCP5]